MGHIRYAKGCFVNHESIRVSCRTCEKLTPLKWRVFSGGHFNPAVTLGVTISGALPVVNAIVYVVSQLLGAMMGSLLVWVKRISPLAWSRGRPHRWTNRGHRAIYLQSIVGEQQYQAPNVTLAALVNSIKGGITEPPGYWGQVRMAIGKP